MGRDDPVLPAVPLLNRVLGLILRPREEWPRIDLQPMTIASILRSHVLILAAVPAVAQFIGSLLFGRTYLGLTWHPGVGDAFNAAVTQYALAIAGVFLLALLIDWLAPGFGGIRDRVQAFKVAAYSSTAVWLAGIFAALPAIGFLGLLGLYGIYLLHLGLPRLMKAPADRSLGYTVVTTIAAMMLALTATAVAGPIERFFGGSLPSPDMPAARSGTGKVAGVDAADRASIEAASRQIEDVGRKIKAGDVEAVPSARLKALLPERIAAYRRTTTETSSVGANGIGGSSAEARYEDSDKFIELSVTDLSALGALAALGTPPGVERAQETETGYQRRTTVDGHVVTEEWDRVARQGSYMVVVADRFVVRAHGVVDDIDDLASAAATVDPRRLEKLAR